MAAQILCDQISTISNMVQGMSNAASKEAILAGNFQSVFTQIGQRHLNTEDGELIVRHVDESEFTQTQKESLKAALAERLVARMSSRGGSKTITRSMQNLEDIAPFLTEADVQLLGAYRVTPEKVFFWLHILMSCRRPCHGRTQVL